MNETWEETKARFKKIGVFVSPDLADVNTADVVIPPTPRYEAPARPRATVPLYEIRKVTLPPDKKYEHGKVVVYGVTLQEAEWWLEHRLKPKSYQDDVTEMKTLVFYEKFLIGASPKERSIYSNPERFCTEDFPEVKSPEWIG